MTNKKSVVEVIDENGVLNIIAPPTKFSNEVISLKKVGTVNLSELLKKRPVVSLRKFLVKVTSKGAKGCWWNRFVDNFFVVEQVFDNEQGRPACKTVYLSDISGQKMFIDSFNNREIPIEFVKVIRPFAEHSNNQKGTKEKKK